MGKLLLLLWSFSLFLTLAALAHWGLWHWLRRSFPRWTARHRSLLLGGLGVMFLLPLARLIVVLTMSPRSSSTIWATIAALGMLWHLVVGGGMAPVYLHRLGQGIWRRFGVSRAQPALLRPFVSEAELSPEPAAPPPEPGGRRAFLEQVGGTIALAASGGMVGWGAVRGRYEWQVDEIPIRLSRLPKALDGFTIAQISDLHVGTFIGERELALGLEVVRRVRADLIVITGDIVDFDPGYIALAARRLGALSAREGIVCIPGNHDYYTGAKGVMDGMARAGIDVLLNRGKVIARGDGGISILGVDDLSAARPSSDQGPGPDLPRALAMVPPDLASVLLAHQPRFVDRYARAGKGPRVDLQLSGHTHGGQINPGFSPAGLFLPYLAGRYDVGDTVLYVNRGFGTSGPPSRVGAPPEITKIVLVSG